MVVKTLRVRMNNTKPLSSLKSQYANRNTNETDHKAGTSTMVCCPLFQEAEQVFLRAEGCEEEQFC